MEVPEYKMVEVPGYKIFNGDMTNWYGLQFEEGRTYHTIRKPGFYYCTKLSEVFGVYFGNPSVQVARVTGYIEEEREASFRKYSTTVRTAVSLRIDKILTREEIMQQVIADGESSIKDYLRYFPVTTEEEDYFVENYGDNEELMEIIAYNRRKAAEKGKPKTREKTGYVYRPFKKEKKEKR